MCRAATAVAQRHGGGLTDAPRTVIQAFRAEEGALPPREVRLEVSARASRTTPALARDRRPAPAPAPPQPRRGTKNVQSPVRFARMAGLWGTRAPSLPQSHSPPGGSGCGLKPLMSAGCVKMVRPPSSTSSVGTMCGWGPSLSIGLGVCS